MELGFKKLISSVISITITYVKAANQPNKYIF